MHRAASFAACVLAVLACATVAFVARGALPGDSAWKPVLGSQDAVVTGAAGGAFSLAGVQVRGRPAGAALIATAKRRSVRVYPRANRRNPRVLAQRVLDGHGIPLVFLVRRLRAGWARVELPTRPNLSSAWVRREDIRVSYTRMRVRVSLRRHRLEAFDGSRLVARTGIGVGASVSPTPKGRYFVTDVVRPPDPGGFYGPYALGLSAHSDVYSSYAGGSGQIGIHGTNRPESVGKDASHGCLRVPNGVITRLAHVLPLGTPVTIA